MSSSVLKEFLIKLSIKSDPQSVRNFQETMGRIAKGTIEMSKTFVQLGEATALTASGMVVALAAKAHGAHLATAAK